MIRHLSCFITSCFITSCFITMLFCTVVGGHGQPDENPMHEWKALRKEIRFFQERDESKVSAMNERIEDLAGRMEESHPRRTALLLTEWADQLYNSFFKDQRVLPLYQRACRLHRRSGDEAKEAWLRVKIANSHQCRGDLDEALRELEKAQSFYQEGGNPRTMAMTTRMRGDCLLVKRQFDEALCLLEQAFSLALETGSDQLLAVAAQSRGEAYLHTDRYEEALEDFDRTLAYFRESESPVEQYHFQTARIRRCRALLHLGRAAEVIEDVEQATRYFEKIGDTEMVGDGYNLLGSAFMALGRYEEALDAYDKAIDIHCTIDSTAAATARCNRAIILRIHGRYMEALREFERGERLFEKAGESLQRIQARCNKAGLLSFLGRMEEAETNLRQALEWCRNHKRPYIAASVKMDLGILCLNAGRYEEALSLLDEAETFYNEIGSEPDMMNLAKVQGTVLRFLKRPEEALSVLERAESYYRNNGDLAGLYALASPKSNVLFDMGRLDEALSLVAKVEGYYRRIGHESELAHLYHIKGMVQSERGRFSDALKEYADSADWIGRCLSMRIQSLGEDTSISFRQSNYSILADALRVFHQIESPKPDHIAMAYSVAQVYHGFGLSDILMERGAIREGRIPEDLRMRFRDARARLDGAHQTRARLMREQNVPKSMEDRKRLKEETAQAESDLRESERAFDEVLEEIRVANTVDASFVHPEPASLAEVQALLPEGCALLEYVVAGEFVEAFVIAPDLAELLRIGTVDEIRESVQGVLECTRPGGSYASSQAQAGALRELGKTVLDPVLRTFAKKKVHTLLIAPDGDLCRIPLEALLCADVPPGQDMERWPFLIRDYAIAYVCSGTALRQKSKAKGEDAPASRRPRLVAFGCPSYGTEETDPAENTCLVARERGSLALLPQTASEVLQIAGIFASSEEEQRRLGDAEQRLSENEFHPGTEDRYELRGERFTLFLGPAANEYNLKNSPEVTKATVLHLACHGLADLTSPALSCLVLSMSSGLERETGEDGFVTLRELGSLGIQAELVVLSACESNRGVVRPFDGMAGLGRAVMLGGARAVLSTLWEVQDRSARDLIVQFYRNWLQEEGRSRIEALAEAKRHAIREGLPLHTWAAYTLWDAVVRDG